MEQFRIKLIWIWYCLYWISKKIDWENGSFWHEVFGCLCCCLEMSVRVLFGHTNSILWVWVWELSTVRARNYKDTRNSYILYKKNPKSIFCLLINMCLHGGQFIYWLWVGLSIKRVTGFGSGFRNWSRISSYKPDSFGDFTKRLVTHSFFAMHGSPITDSCIVPDVFVFLL